MTTAVFRDKYFNKIERKQSEFLRNEMFVDLTLISADKIEVVAHRLIVAATWKSVYVELKKIEKASTSVSLPVQVHIPYANGEVLKSLVAYTYSGHFNDDWDILECYKAGVNAGYESMVSACCEQMVYGVASGKLEKNVLLAELFTLVTEYPTPQLVELLRNTFSVTPFSPIWLEKAKPFVQDNFEQLLAAGRLVMFDDRLFLEKAYTRKLTSLVDLVTNGIKLPLPVVERLKKRVASFSITIHPRFSAPSVLAWYEKQAFGFHQPLNLDDTCDSTYCTFTEFPPDKWVVSGFQCRIMENWENRQPLEYLQVQYRNIRSGERAYNTRVEEVDHNLQNREFEEEVLLNDDEVVCAVDLNSGYLIDQITFITNKHRRVGPFGRSTGGNRWFIPAPSSNFRKDAFVGSSEYDESLRLYRQNANKQLLPTSKDQIFVNFDECLGLTFHGFLYHLYYTQGYRAWNVVNLVFAGWPLQALTRHALITQDELAMFSTVEI